MKVTINLECTNIIKTNGKPYKKQFVTFPFQFDYDGDTLPPAVFIGVWLERQPELLNKSLSKFLKTKIKGFDFMGDMDNIEIN